MTILNANKMKQTDFGYKYFSDYGFVTRVRSGRNLKQDTLIKLYNVLSASR